MLSKRVISAIFIVIYLICMFYFGGWFFRLSALLFAIIGMHEIYTAAENKGYKPIKWLGYCFAAVIFLCFTFNVNIKLILIIVLFTIICLSVPIFKFNKYDPLDSAFTIVGFLYPGLIFLLFIPFNELCLPRSSFILMLTFLATWGTDTFAYFSGIAFGKTKLIPSISPKKTVEGSIGGFLGSILTSIVLGLIGNYKLGMTFTVYNYIIIGIICGTLSQIGDLAASVFKRYCDIKDYGKILPGHGGIMDRFDSILFTVPAIYLYFLLFLA
jgi:phosphatidate cytidylyltransferase